MDAKKTARKKIRVPYRDSVKLIPVKDIYCFWANEKYVTIYFAEAGRLCMVDSAESVKSLVAEFSELFILSHRGWLVSRNRISGMIKNPIGGFELEVSGMADRPKVSRRHESSVRRFLKSFDA